MAQLNLESIDLESLAPLQDLTAVELREVSNINTTQTLMIVYDVSRRQDLPFKCNPLLFNIFIAPGYTESQSIATVTDVNTTPVMTAVGNLASNTQLLEVYLGSNNNIQIGEIEGEKIRAINDSDPSNSLVWRERRDNYLFPYQVAMTTGQWARLGLGAVNIQWLASFEGRPKNHSLCLRFHAEIHVIQKAILLMSALKLFRARFFFHTHSISSDNLVRMSPLRPDADVMSCMKDVGSSELRPYCVTPFDTNNTAVNHVCELLEVSTHKVNLILVFMEYVPKQHIIEFRDTFGRLCFYLLSDPSANMLDVHHATRDSFGQIDKSNGNIYVNGQHAMESRLVAPFKHGQNPHCRVQHVYTVREPQVRVAEAALSDHLSSFQICVSNDLERDLKAVLLAYTAYLAKTYFGLLSIGPLPTMGSYQYRQEQ